MSFFKKLFSSNAKDSSKTDKKIIFLFLIAFFYTNLHALPFSQYEKVNLYCHFYYENGSSTNLGKMKGISRCQNATHSWARKNNITDTDWDYIGCVIKEPVVLGGITMRKGSNCSEKIK